MQFINILEIHEVHVMNKLFWRIKLYIDLIIFVQCTSVLFYWMIYCPCFFCTWSVDCSEKCQRCIFVFMLNQHCTVSVPNSITNAYKLKLQNTARVSITNGTPQTRFNEHSEFLNFRLYWRTKASLDPWGQFSSWNLSTVLQEELSWLFSEIQVPGIPLLQQLF